MYLYILDIGHCGLKVWSKDLCYKLVKLLQTVKFTELILDYATL